MVFISVDFPAPLSPTSATTSPGSTRKSTLSSAWTWRKDLEMPRASSNGGVPFSTGAASLPFSISPPATRENLIGQARWHPGPRRRPRTDLVSHARYDEVEERLRQ